MILRQFFRTVKAVLTTKSAVRCVLCKRVIDDKTQAINVATGWVHRLMCPPRQPDEPRPVN